MVHVLLTEDNYHAFEKIEEAEKYLRENKTKVEEWPDGEMIKEMYLWDVLTKLPYK